MVDLNTVVGAEVAARIAALEQVIRVRVID